MTTLRSYLDPDRQSGPPGPTVFKTERNQYELRCGLCCRVSYVDEDTFAFVTEATKMGLDDPFRCEKCNEEYDDLAYEG